jgi:SAM-dependent methyltransferase
MGLNEFDRSWAQTYRGFDEARSGAAEHYGTLLTRLTSQFGRAIDVLDLGCGTGRYFHCLRNVRRLVGIDPSEYMLEQARTPTQAETIAVDKLELICGDVFSVPLPDAAFDLIYSVGVVGEYAPFDGRLLDRCRQLLKPGGVLFVTAVDTLSRVRVPEIEQPSLLRRAARSLWPSLPPWIRIAANRVLSPRYVSRRQLERCLPAAGFRRYEIATFEHPSGWRGTHFDCTAVSPTPASP